MDFQVRKGLETPLKITGMYTHYFCIYCVTGGVLVLVIVGVLTNLMSGYGSWLSLILTMCVSAIGFIVLRVVLINLSTQKKYSKFSRRIFVISNKDLLQNL